MKTQWIKDTWDWLKGKKRNLGIIALTVLDGITVFSPDMLTPEKYRFFVGVVNVLLLGAGLDAVRRTEKGKKIQKTIIDAGKKILQKQN